jgi:hypothetical protein
MVTLGDRQKGGEWRILSFLQKMSRENALGLDISRGEKTTRLIPTGQPP